MEPEIDLSRRRFLLRKSQPEVQPVRPPWLIAAVLAERCTRCSACVEACPETILLRGDGGFPVVDFSRGECSFCGLCADACPEPGLFAPREETPWSLVARIADGCLTASGVFCQSCGDSCPERAIRFRPVLRGAPRPEVRADACTGCGACVGSCPSSAVEVRPQ